MALRLLYALSCWAVANVNSERVRTLHHQIIALTHEPLVVRSRRGGIYLGDNNATQDFDLGDYIHITLIPRW